MSRDDRRAGPSGGAARLAISETGVLGVTPCRKVVALCDAWVGGTGHAGFLVDYWLARIAVFPAWWVDHGILVPVVVYRTGEAARGIVVLESRRHG